MTSRFSPRAFAHGSLVSLAVLAVSAVGCTTYTGSGGGAGVVTIGGAPGVVCDPSAYSQGCSGATKVSCDATAKTWVSIGDCAAGQVCVAKADPAAPNTVKRIAVCVTPGAGPADAGTGGGNNDAMTSGDAGTTTDTGSGATSDTGSGTTKDTGSGGGDTGAGDTGAGDTGTGGTGGAWMQCVSAKCASQWASCKASSACAIAAACVDGCTDKTCQQLCFNNTSGEDQNRLISVIMCAEQVGCKGATSGPKCGNGTCEAGETTSTCPQDCKSAGPVCGDGKCEAGESATTCAKDCKVVAQCGNGKCEAGETPSSCLADCKPPCGDGKCELGEAPNTCPQDCGPKTVCGNGTCESGETASSCPKDCGPKTVCGNGTCESGETASSCPKDCGGSGGTCIEQKCSKELQTCTTSAACTGIFLMGSMQGCIDQYNCKDSTCLQSNCSKEAGACQNNTSCNSLWGCLAKCTDQACQQKCLDATGLSQYDALVKCAQKNCSTP